MKKLFLSLIVCVISLAASAHKEGGCFYCFKVKSIDGTEFAFSQLRGKKVMVVNVASKCGLTPQYERLQALYEKYKDSGLVIIAFPANNFGSQEPGTNEQIAEFCTANYGVSFPVMEKISVKGDDMAPLYRWLTSKQTNGVEDVDVTWNFQKFLIDRDGRWVRSVPPRTLPDDASIIAWIEEK